MIEFTKRVLSNGMRLLHHYDPNTRMVAVNIMCHAGSRDEQQGKTGLAHLLEHLMFTGSKNASNYDEILQAAGGDSNAWTNSDVTNYYDILPAQNIETAFWLESDRLNDLLLDDHSIEVQRSVVTQEFRQRCSNVPYGDISHLVHELAYLKHPYRWPTIGQSEDDIQHITRDDILSFYNSNYVSGNIVMCVSGNVPFSKTLDMAEKWFSDIRCGNPLRHYQVEPRQLAPKSLTVKRDIPQEMIVIAYKMCARRDKDFPVCDMISDILANGKSARFTQNILMHTDIFTDLDAAVEGVHDPGLFLIRGKLAEGASLSQAECLIMKELQKLTEGEIENSELSKCANKFLSTSLFENISYLPKATKLCQYELLDDVNMVNDEIEQYRKISAADIARVSSTIFDENNKCILYYKKE